MPCYEPPEKIPTRDQRENQMTASILCWLCDKKGYGHPIDYDRLPTWRAWSEDRFLDANECGKVLCAIVEGMSEAEREKFIYDAHNRMSRRFADWWEDHQEADRQRIAREKEIAVMKSLMEAGHPYYFLKNLTRQERLDIKRINKALLGQMVDEINRRELSFGHTFPA